MGFFDENFYKELDKSYSGSSGDTFNDEESYQESNLDLGVNKGNKEKFNDIMDNASTKNDVYWDSNNFVVRILLFVLGIIIFLALLYYAIGWFNIS